MIIAHDAAAPTHLGRRSIGRGATLMKLKSLCLCVLVHASTLWCVCVRLTQHYYSITGSTFPPSAHTHARGRTHLQSVPSVCLSMHFCERVQPLAPCPLTFHQCSNIQLLLTKVGIYHQRCLDIKRSISFHLHNSAFEIRFRRRLISTMVIKHCLNSFKMNRFCCF